MKPERNRADRTDVPWPPGAVGLTKEQMAAALQVSVRTLNGMMERGEISYYKIGSKLVRFRLEDALKRMGETVLVQGGN